MGHWKNSIGSPYPGWKTDLVFVTVLVDQWVTLKESGLSDRYLDIAKNKKKEAVLIITWALGTIPKNHAK